MTLISYHYLLNWKFLFFRIDCWKGACVCIAYVVFETSCLDFTSKNWHGSELASYLMDNTKSISAISPFACLSGVVDNDLFHGEVINKVSHFFMEGRILLQFNKNTFFFLQSSCLWVIWWHYAQVSLFRRNNLKGVPTKNNQHWVAPHYHSARNTE